MKQVSAFTDGACSGNPGPGGWGAVLQFGDHERELHGGAEDTTNNRMELTAAIEALRALSEPCRVSLTTDSTYVKDGITQWLTNWKRNGWRTAAKKPVKIRTCGRRWIMKRRGMRWTGVGSRATVGILKTNERTAWLTLA